MRYTVFAFALCLLVVSAHAGTYVETFDDGDFDGWEVFNPAEWKVVDGVVTCRRPVNWSTGLRFGEDEWRNYSIECDAIVVEKLANQPGLGLNLRSIVKNNSNFSVIWCLLSGDNSCGLIYPWLNGGALAQTPRRNFDFQYNKWHRIKGVAHEDTFEFYIDGELMASLSDTRFPTGRVDLRANSCEAHFDNVVITGDDVPDNTAAVSASGKLATRWGQLRRK